MSKAVKTRGPLFVGVDIGKESLDAGAPGFSLRVPNTREGCAELIRAARKARSRVHFICESTGLYGRLLVGFLHARRCKVSVMPGAQVRQFAKATRRFAKTDKIDAALLAELGATLRPEPTPKAGRGVLQLRQIVRRRRQLQMLLTIQRSQRLGLTTALVKKTVENIQRAVSEAIESVDELARRLIESDPVLLAKHAAFCAVDGMGWRSATYVLAECPEIGRLNRRQIAALSGLAPYNQDSGTTQMGRHIYGGRVHLRSGIFMAAMVAAHHNPVLKPFYERLRGRGKPGQVALVAVARKLLIYLNRLAKQFEPGEAARREGAAPSPVRAKKPRERAARGKISSSPTASRRRTNKHVHSHKRGGDSAGPARR